MVKFIKAIMDIVETLQNNPIFQLSLSSKELFHSNFLAWLAEDKNTRGIFNQLMQVWLNDPIWEFKEEEMMVKREYKNFDFCICQKVRNYHIKKRKKMKYKKKNISLGQSSSSLRINSRVYLTKSS